MVLLFVDRLVLVLSLVDPWERRKFAFAHSAEDWLAGPTLFAGGMQDLDLCVALLVSFLFENPADLVGDALPVDLRVEFVRALEHQPAVVVETLGPCLRSDFLVAESPSVQ